MSILTATARPIDGGLRHEVDVNGRHTITTDEPEYLGGTDTAPAPHELLAAMLASCASTMIALYARRRGWRLDDLRVDVSYDTDANPRRVAVTLHLPQEFSADQIERLKRVADACPARRALEAGFTFDEQPALDLPATDSPQPSDGGGGLQIAVRSATDAGTGHGILGRPPPASAARQ